MVLNVSLGFQNLTNSDGKEAHTKTYALLIADTVVVRAEKVEVATRDAPKTATAVLYTFKVGVLGF